MPGGDGTGPFGMGPMTGRAAGFCAGLSVPGYMNPMPGRSLGKRGRGLVGRGGGRGGRGWRHQFYATGLTGWQRAAMGAQAFGAAVAVPASDAAPVAAMSTEQQLDMLKGQAEYFEGALDGIRRRIEELQAKNQKN